MKKNIYILLLLGYFCFAPNIGAQIKIGNTTPPSSFSILELETTLEKGGIRLPRLTQQKCGELKTYLTSLSASDREKANGLVVYNTDDRTLQYWDGTDWVSVKYEHRLVGENGVTALDDITGSLELGGKLNQASTTVGMNNYSLNFPVKDDNDQFVVSNTDTGENPLNIKDGKVGIGGTASPEKILDIYNSNTEAPALKITNSNEKSGYLLASDFFGNALWQPLKPLASVVPGSLNTSSYQFGAYNDEYDHNITSEPLRLSRGKWLIVAKFTARSGAGDGTQKDYFVYLKLRKSTDRNPPQKIKPDSYGTNYTKLTTTSALPTKNTYTGPDGVSSQIYATPQVLYYAEVHGNDEYFHVLASSSRTFVTTPAYGSYFFALRIDGMGMAVAVQGSTTCGTLTSVNRTLETGQTLSPEPTGTVNISLTSGSLYLEDGDYIGSTNGINLVVTGGPYNLTTGTTRTVSVKVAGTLETRVKSGTFNVPVEIANASFSPNCQGPTITVPTKGSLNCDLLSNYNIYTGRGRNINITNAQLGLDITSGSIDLTSQQILASANGLNLHYNDPNNTTIYATNNVNLPVSIIGTISNTAAGTFKLMPALAPLTACSNGPTINVVIAQLDCGNTIQSPSNTPVYSIVPIDIVVDPASASYTLKSGQVLGEQSGIKVSHIGPDLQLIPGTTHTINTVVSSGSTIKGVGNYTVNLSALYNYGIDACVMNINVMYFGKFGSISVDRPITSGNLDISRTIPLTVTTKSVTINPNEGLGTTTANGKTYQVIADISSAITVNEGNTANIPVKISGPEDTAVRSYTVNLNKAIGIESNTVTINFVAYGSFGSIPPINANISSGNVNTTISVPLTIDSNSVTINNGDVLGSVTSNGKTYQVIATSNVTVTAGNTANIPVRISGPEETTSGRSYTIPLNKVTGVISSNIIINFN